MKISEVVITPETAKAYLETNVNNRPLNKSHIKFLAGEMLAGRWKRNGDTICLNGSRLIDGQHRLHAVIESGVPMPAIVVEGLDDNVFDTKDCGKRRSAADVLSIRGEKNTTLLAATVVFVDRYMHGQLESKRREYSHIEIEELVAKYGDDLRKSVALISGMGTKRLVRSSIAAGLHFIFSRFDAEAADTFWRSLIGGHDLDRNSPIYVLRERLVANTMAKSRLRPEYVAALCIKAWNHMRSGTSVKYLRWHEQGRTATDFPLAH